VDLNPDCHVDMALCSKLESISLANTWKMVVKTLYVCLQGFYTSSVINIQGQLNMTDVTKVVVSHRGGVELREAEITVAVYAECRGIRYVDTARSVTHTFDTFGTCDIDDIISIEQLMASKSIYVIDGSLYVRVFVRPVSFAASPVSPDCIPPSPSP